MNRRERSWWYLFELFVVFLGVTLAFMLDRWPENHRLRSQEREYLEGLHRDVVADSSNLAGLLDFYRKEAVRSGENSGLACREVESG